MLVTCWCAWLRMVVYSSVPAEAVWMLRVFLESFRVSDCREHRCQSWVRWLICPFAVLVLKAIAVCYWVLHMHLVLDWCICTRELKFLGFFRSLDAISSPTAAAVTKWIAIGSYLLASCITRVSGAFGNAAVENSALELRMENWPFQAGEEPCSLWICIESGFH